MLKKLFIISALIGLTACASTSQKSTDLVPYQNDRSLAWNVMNQVGASNKLRDVDAPGESAVMKKGVAGHLTSAIFSTTGFFSGLAGSMMMDMDTFTNKTNIIFAVDLHGTKGDGSNRIVADYFMKALSLRSPEAVFQNYESNGNRVSFDVISHECNTWSARKCHVVLPIEYVGQADPKLFKSNQLTTIRVTNTRENKYSLNVYMNYLTNAYIFHPQNEFSRQMVNGAISNIGNTPPFVEYNQKAFLFIKPQPVGNEIFVPLNDIPNQQYLMSARTPLIQ